MIQYSMSILHGNELMTYHICAGVAGGGGGGKLYILMISDTLIKLIFITYYMPV